MKYLLEWLVLSACAACLGASVAAAAASTQRRRRHSHDATPSSTSTTPTSSSTSFGEWPELALVRRLYDDCQDKNDFIGCLKQKALNALTRAIGQDSIKIMDGLVMEKQKQNQSESESILGLLTDARQFGSLSPLDRALLFKADKLIRTHSLKIDIMDVADLGNEGRGHEHGGHKKKKHKDGGHIKYVIAALLTAMGIAGPLGLKALAAIAGKALVISKVALTIAGIIALKKLFSHDHSEETSFQVHAGDHNRRNTYVIRPVSKTNAGVGVTAAGSSSSVDPYRYYYDYSHQQ
ncbi:uncharacterized protein Dwil_GK21104 [Drosophila willistoni]|uniref:Osiris 21 n=1 Tax=Drosophila willistoni TaxID=7260 RepID=B4N7A8_DROWI|nr:uncharacterized protein LOC6646583 [Drosophila willistoni]EDW80249.1 uncharacterized protein Dwil_GK21104 [Drosophila willistoni]